MNTQNNTNSEKKITSATSATICMDIWQTILEYSEFIDQINICRVNTNMYGNLKIRDLYYVHIMYRQNFTDHVLKQKIYSETENIDLSYAKNVTDINYLKNIKLLDISVPFSETYNENEDIIDEPSLINNDSIKEINPINLNLCGNKSITNISHMSNLKYLNASYSNITFEHIKNLKLKTIKIAGTTMNKDMFIGMPDTIVIEYSYDDDGDYDDYDDYDDYNGNNYDSEMEDRYDDYLYGLSSFERNTGDYSSFNEYKNRFW